MLGVQAVMLAALLALLLGHAAWRRARVAWLRPRVDAARAAVARALAGGEAPPPLPHLPPAAAVRVFADATSSVDTSTRGRLAVFASYAVLTTRASRWCSSRWWPRRLKGARLLTLLGTGEDAVPPLLDDVHPEVRSEAAAWVAQHPTASRTARVVEMLDDEALSCRLVAQATLIRLGRRALDPLIAYLDSAKPTPLAAALLVAARLRDPSLRAATFGHAAHPHPAVRAGVARVLTGVGGEGAVDTLQRYLADADAEVRAAAVEGLGSLGHWPSAPALAERLGDRAWRVRRAAGLALRRLGGPGRLYLQRASRTAADPFAVDMARQTLDLPAPVASGPQAC